MLTLATFASLFIRQNFAEVWSSTTNILFVLLVAMAKASLVILFMHWKYERGWKFVLCIPTILLAVIAVLALLRTLLTNRMRNQVGTARKSC